jgi:hypothetical protein
MDAPASSVCAACKDQAGYCYQDAQPPLPSAWQRVRATLRAEYEGFLLLRCRTCGRHWRITHDLREGFWQTAEYPPESVARLNSNRWEAEATKRRGPMPSVAEVRGPEPPVQRSLTDVVALLGHVAVGALLGCVGYYVGLASTKIYRGMLPLSYHVVVGMVVFTLIWRSGRTK